MTSRSETLQSFVDAASVAFCRFAQDADGRRTALQVFSALEVPVTQTRAAGRRLPVCSHLERALAIETDDDSLRCLIDRFKSIEPGLQWRQRATYEASASANFAEGHANAMIVGPGGLEDRRDAWLGVTLMAPAVRYPDHNHEPEEVYLVLSEGEFRQGEGAWFAPGIGGSLHNTSNIRHAMRSLDTPLFAFWALRSAKK